MAPISGHVFRKHVFRKHLAFLHALLTVPKRKFICWDIETILASLNECFSRVCFHINESIVQLKKFVKTVSAYPCLAQVTSHLVLLQLPDWATKEVEGFSFTYGMRLYIDFIIIISILLEKTSKYLQKEKKISQREKNSLMAIIRFTCVSVKIIRIFRSSWGLFQSYWPIMWRMITNIRHGVILIDAI